MIPYGRQFIDDEDIKAVVEVLKSDYVTQGPKVEEFERVLASYCGAKYAVTFNSGTSALHGAYFAAGLQRGDEFIISPITFVATANAGVYLGAKPVFVDIEHDTGNIDANLVEKVITEKTKIIVPVHYAGHPCDMEKIKEIANKYDIKIVEDACHALGAKYKGEKVGICKYSDMTVFSFHPVKHITTGEGGAVLTNNEEYYEKLKMFRSHGITKDNNKFTKEPDGDWYYEMQFLGYNYRMTDIQAALGISQLKKIDMFVEKRREIAKKYNEAFRDNPYFDIPIEKEYAYHSYHLYPIRLKEKYADRKKKIFQLLREKGLGVQVHYIPVYLQPYYQKMGYDRSKLRIAYNFYKSQISLPIYFSFNEDDFDFVVSQVFKVMEPL